MGYCWGKGNQMQAHCSWLRALVQEPENIPEDEPAPQAHPLSGEPPEKPRWSHGALAATPTLQPISGLGSQQGTDFSCHSWAWQLSKHGNPGG